jgi:GrpB-like predicted nucleotidyltransferase (UPF0157 family)
MRSQQRQIEVLAYNPVWAERFEQERVKLCKAISDNAVAIEHIGSTSVVGLAAKPIVDILIEVRDLEKLDQQQSNIEGLGYVAKGENTIVGRRYFQKGGIQRSHHIHAFQTGNLHLKEHRAFRDYLSAHSQIANSYAQIKKYAASECGHDIERYMQLKNDFITHHMKLALAWHKAL